MQTRKGEMFYVGEGRFLHDDGDDDNGDTNSTDPDVAGSLRPWPTTLTQAV